MELFCHIMNVVTETCQRIPWRQKNVGIKYDIIFEGDSGLDYYMALTMEIIQIFHQLCYYYQLRLGSVIWQPNTKIIIF